MVEVIKVVRMFDVVWVFVKNWKVGVIEVSREVEVVNVAE